MEDSLSAVPAHAPSPSQFGLKARVEAPETATLGDTVGLTIHVTWTDAPHPWLLLPQTSPETAKLSQVGMAMEQNRVIQDGKESPEIVVRYQLLAKDTGTTQIPALSFDIPVQSGGAMHLLTVPATVRIDAPFQPMPWVLGGVGFAILLLLAGFLYRRRRLRHLVTERALTRIREQRQAFETLANRAQNADPRSWMIELEVFFQQVGIAPHPREDQEAALRKLQEAFAQSRYGGGPRDSWELKEWLRLARTALQFNREDQEDQNG